MTCFTFVSVLIVFHYTSDVTTCMSMSSTHILVLAEAEVHIQIQLVYLAVDHTFQLPFLVGENVQITSAQWFLCFLILLKGKRYV